MVWTIVSTEWTELILVRGMVTTGNKKTLIERLLLANQINDTVTQSPQLRSRKRRRTVEHDPVEEQSQHNIAHEATNEDTSFTDEQNMNRQVTHLSEWEQD